VATKLLEEVSITLDELYSDEDDSLGFTLDELLSSEDDDSSGLMLDELLTDEEDDCTPLDELFADDDNCAPLDELILDEEEFFSSIEELDSSTLA
jgi:hypothetical protein